MIAMLPTPQATGRPRAATIPLTTSGKQELIRRLSRCLSWIACATRMVSRAWNTAVALSPPSATSALQASP